MELTQSWAGLRYSVFGIRESGSYRDRSASFATFSIGPIDRSVALSVDWAHPLFIHFNSLHFFYFLPSFLYLFLWFSPRSIFGAASRCVQEVCAIKLSGYGFMELY